MHDPMVVAFEIRRPWPRRERFHDAKPGQPRWRFKLHHNCLTCSDKERAEHAGRSFFPWWKPSSWTPFWTIAGRGIYWPGLITVWHVEPGGHNSGEVCPHYDRWQDPDGTWNGKLRHGWRFHVWHWRIQIHPAQHLRRWALTRCAWCGGRSHKGAYVNVSHSWDGPRGRWWQGEPGLYHMDCSSVEHAHRVCICNDPLPFTPGDGRCALCGKYLAFGANRSQPALDAYRLLSSQPRGQKPSPEAMAAAKRLWEAARAAEQDEAAS